MSGTSLDGVDAVIARFDPQPELVASHYLPMPAALRSSLLTLNAMSPDELHEANLAANALAHLYAEAVAALLAKSGLTAADVIAIGNHGQTVRHRPDCGYTVQLGNASLLAELTGIPVIADFRSRDVAAGGQGAPLVPAFHRALFARQDTGVAVLNLGGIANLTWLSRDGRVLGFDTGPGNVLLDLWCERYTGEPYDRDGQLAAAGQVNGGLLAAMLAEPFFVTPPPKSTGRDLFNAAWLARFATAGLASADVQATLAALTSQTCADALKRHCPDTSRLYVCGGGARNPVLMAGLQQNLPGWSVEATDALGIPADWLEAFAFAWLAWRFLNGQSANLPAVTGAKGERILGCYYPA